MNTLTVKELRGLAKDAKVKVGTNLKKEELIKELYNDRHCALIFDYMEDYGVSLEIAQDMASE